MNETTILKLCGGGESESVASNIFFVMMDALFLFLSRILQSLISEGGDRLMLLSLYVSILPDLPLFHRPSSACRMSGTATQNC
jgi:hypothetical protein